MGAYFPEGAANRLSVRAGMKPPLESDATASKILVVGGYGHVGTRVCRRLAPLFPNRVVVAGRDEAMAKWVAERSGFGAQGRKADLDAPDDIELRGVAVVLLCAARSSREFARRCLTTGIHYVDISADAEFLHAVECLAEDAKRSRATAVLSVGMAPGLANLLAARAVATPGTVRRVDIVVELGLGDVHGEAAIAWMLDSLDETQQYVFDGKTVEARSLSRSALFDLPGLGRRRAYLFPFSEQARLGKSLEVPEVATWLCLSSEWLMWLLALGSRLGLTRWFSNRRVRRWLIAALRKGRFGGNECFVAALATRSDVGDRVNTVAIQGRREGLMTAVSAAETVRQLLNEPPPPGVFHSEEVVKIEPLLNALRREVPGFVALSSSPRGGSR